MVVETEKKYEEPVNSLIEWIKSQPHLPQQTDKLLLSRYIFSCRDDLEKAKNLYELNMTMRNNAPNIFLNRDPMSPEIQKAMLVSDIVPLVKTTPDNHKIIFCRLIDCDADKYNFNDQIQLFFMASDIRLIYPDSESGIRAAGEIPIYDMKGMSLRHITKTVLTTLRTYMKFTQEAMPVRLKNVHVINCNSFIDRIIMLIKPFMRKGVFEMLHFHTEGSETLYKYVPKCALPDEYGGEGGSLVQMKKDWIKRIEANRDYLRDEKYWKIDNSRKNSNKKKTTEELYPNLKNLCID